MLHRNWAVFLFHVVHILLFAGVTGVFYRCGIAGYGYAEIVALLLSVLHRSLRRVIGAPGYGIAALWWAAIAIGSFWHDLGLWDIAVPIVALLCPPSLLTTEGLLLHVSAVRHHHAT